METPEYLARATQVATAGPARTPDMPPLPPTADCLFVTGPTASGKTAVGIELAKMVGAEVLSMDSMALYRGMDVGTAKPSAKERAEIAHHLLDVLEPGQDSSVAQYVAMAESVVDQLRQRKVKPLFVGGTPLYLKALLRGIFEGPPADWAWRRQITKEAAGREPRWLHTKLAEIDTQAAARLHPNDTRRLVRALEVHHQTGRPISEWQQQFDIARPASECNVFWIDWPREALAERIDRRVDAMFSDGLVDEVMRLTRDGQPLSHTAAQALGYREVQEHLAGERDLPETIVLVKTHTRQFAKRQRTWFRSLSECRRIEVPEGFDPARIAQDIARYLP